jgi:hypothetical protein
MFKCKACPEKDARIKELKEQILYLRSLVLPVNDPYNPPLIEQEADKAMSASDQPIVATEEQYEELKKLDDTLSERDKLLSGNY